MHDRPCNIYIIVNSVSKIRAVIGWISITCHQRITIFADQPFGSQVRLQYFSQSWNDWVDVTESFRLETSVQIKMLVDDGSTKRADDDSRKRKLLDVFKNVAQTKMKKTSMKSRGEVRINIG